MFNLQKKSTKCLKILLIFFTLLFYSKLTGQEIKGLVVDQKNGEALAFVNIVSNNQWIGSSGIDGKFTLNFFGNELVFSVIGYYSVHLKTESITRPLVVRMTPKTYDLDEIVIKPAVNPALRIIANAVKNSEQHNPKSLNSFAHQTYDRLVISADTNAIPRNNPALSAHFSKRDLMIMETISERTYRFPGKQQEHILATRVSGLKDPAIVFLLSQLHTTDFYGEQIEIDNKKYVSPISRLSLEKYQFTLEESIPDGTDTLFMVSFLPNQTSRFESLRGVLGIHSDGWAVQSVTASPFQRQSSYQIQIRQLYQKINNKHWFPVQLNTRLIIDNLRATGNTVFIGEGSSYNSDIRINEEVDYQPFSDIIINMHPQALDQSDAFWTAHRTDSLSERMIETYRFIDSLGRAAHFDKLLFSIETLIEGKFPVGKIDIAVDQLLKFNNFDGFKPGISLSTNRRLSKRFSISTYVAYPIRDERLVYNASLKIPFLQQRGGYVQFGVFNDNKPTGSTVNFENNRSLTNERSFRQYFVNKMDRVKGGGVQLSLRLLPYLSFEGSFTGRIIQPGYPYSFRNLNDPGSAFNSFESREVKVGLQYRLGENFIQLSDRFIRTGQPNPIITLSVSRIAFNQSIHLESVNKVEFSYEQLFETNYLGSSRIRIEAGACGGSLPFPLMYNLPGTRDPYGLYAPFSFVTMYPNEFVADQYAAVFWQHSLGKLLFGNRRFAPEPMFVTNFAFGRLLNPENHLDLSFKVPEQGYFESGLLLRNILKTSFSGVGIGSLYRFGHYRFTEQRKNFTLNLVISVRLP